VYPTDVALRGIPVPKGTFTVVLRYRPVWFRHGLILFALGILALAFLTITGVQASRWWARRRGAGPAEPPIGTGPSDAAEPEAVDGYEPGHALAVRSLPRTQLDAVEPSLEP
jgi:hypothetical protein